MHDRPEGHPNLARHGRQREAMQDGAVLDQIRRHLEVAVGVAGRHPGSHVADPHRDGNPKAQEYGNEGHPTAEGRAPAQDAVKRQHHGSDRAHPRHGRSTEPQREQIRPAKGLIGPQIDPQPLGQRPAHRQRGIGQQQGGSHWQTGCFRPPTGTHHCIDQQPYQSDGPRQACPIEQPPASQPQRVDGPKGQPASDGAPPEPIRQRGRDAKSQHRQAEPSPGERPDPGRCHAPK